LVFQNVDLVAMIALTQPKDITIHHRTVSAESRQLDFFSRRQFGYEASSDGVIFFTLFEKNSEISSRNKIRRDGRVFLSRRIYRKKHHAYRITARTSACVPRGIRARAQGVGVC